MDSISHSLISPFSDHVYFLLVQNRFCGIWTERCTSVYDFPGFIAFLAASPRWYCLAIYDVSLSLQDGSVPRRRSENVNLANPINPIKCNFWRLSNLGRNELVGNLARLRVLDSVMWSSFSRAIVAILCQSVLLVTSVFFLVLGSLSKHDVDESENVIWKCSVSAIIFQVFKVIMLEKCVLTMLELNCNQRLGNRRTKLNICHHMHTSSRQLQNRSFHVVERTRTFSKCQKIKNARAKRAKILFFIVKYANLWGFCSRRRRGCLSSLLLW